MPVWIRSLAGIVTNRVPTLLTLGVLGGLACWGSLNAWKLPGSSKEAEEADSPVPAIQVLTDSISSGDNDSNSTAKRIEFPSAEAVSKAGIRVVTVQTRPLTQYVIANGMLDYEPSLYARLTARAAGTVWAVYKEIGSWVRKGDVLALIDAVEVGQAKADLMQSLTQVKLRQQTAERIQAAATRGAVSDRSAREAEAALREARIRLSSDHQRLLNLGLPVRLEDITKVPEDELPRYLRLLGLPEEIRKGLDTETLTANLLPLTAPFDGQVIQRNAASGEVIEKNQPKIMFVLGDVRRLHVDLNVNPEDVKELRLGQEVRFGPEGKEPDAAVATLSHISPEVDEKTRRVMVHCEVGNRDKDDKPGHLRPNTFVVGRIIIRKEPQALAVPKEALQSLQADGNINIVFVKTSEKSFVVRPVRPGIREDNLVQVSGVQAGEEVVTAGGFALKSELLKERIVGED
jgi:multidrug efflux pump subunit AcrA (membrane-fusion protein)